MRSKVFFGLVLLLITSNATVAQTTVFTYQGKLADNGNPAPNGNYDFQFSLFDALSGGAQLGTTQTATNILVTNGIFGVTLDFVNCSGCSCPTCFNGSPRFLAIAVKPTAGGSFTPLTPRQPITSTPYAVKSLNAAAADGLSVACLSCVNSSQIASVSGSAVTGAIPVGSVPAGSTNYIQNRTSPPQSSSNFNISGNGTADIFDASTQFNIGGNRILSNGGISNLFAGQGAGNVNTGSSNAFFGRDAGRFNISGEANSFFGSAAGFNNGSGGNNAFFGTNAGVNSVGTANTFVGAGSGTATTSGGGNTMIGFEANTPFPSTLINATAIGAQSFVTQNNSLVLGSIAGTNNAIGDTNVGIGTTAPSQRLHVVGNGLFTGNLTVNGTLNATLPAGSGNYIQNTTTQQQAPVNFNIDGSGTLGGILNANLVSVSTQFNILGDRILSNAGFGNLFAGAGAGFANAGGSDNAFFGRDSGRGNTEGNSNAFFGSSAGFFNTTEFGNTFIGSGAGYYNGNGDASNTAQVNTFIGLEAGLNNTKGFGNVFVGASAGISNITGNRSTAVGYGADFGANNLVNATAIGANARVTQGNSLVLGSINGLNGASADTNVGIGTTAPATKLHVSGTGVIRARVDSDSNAGFALTLSNQPKWSVATTTGGNFLIFNDAITQNAFFIDAATNVIGINALGSAGSSHLCINGSNQISGCSSSMRYKTNIATLHSGLNLISRLRPVTFDWKQNGEPDLGLVAEEVAKVEPLLVTHNDKGEIEGVKYDRVGVLLINTVKEQQQTIDSLQNENLEMKARLAALERLMQQQLSRQHRNIAKTGSCQTMRVQR